MQWNVAECEQEDHLIGNVMTERRKRSLTVTLTRIHTSDFIEHQSLIMRLDLAVDKDRAREGIFWSHLSYINISMKKILIEFCRRSTVPQKFQDCTVGQSLFIAFSSDLYSGWVNGSRRGAEHLRLRSFHWSPEYDRGLCSAQARQLQRATGHNSKEVSCWANRIRPHSPTGWGETALHRDTEIADVRWRDRRTNSTWLRLATVSGREVSIDRCDETSWNR